MTDPHLRVQKLIQRLQSPEYLVRLHAGCLLGQMGPAAKEAVPVLLELLRSGGTADRKLAAWALGYVGSAAEAAAALLAAARDSDESVRMLATSALEKIAAASQTAAAA